VCAHDLSPRRQTNNSENREITGPNRCGKALIGCWGLMIQVAYPHSGTNYVRVTGADGES